MPNIHGLSSIRNSNNNNRPSNDSDSDNDENNRYVGGVSSRGGGSGLAVLPNNDDASESIFNLAEAGSAPSNNNNSSSNNNNGGGEVRRMITMYRSGFTVDNGPYRQLNDPSNAEFLGSLARGLIPRELREDGGEEGEEVMVGLVDKRGEEYDEERHGQPQQQPSSSSSGGFQSFSGQGQSLIDSSTSTTTSSSSGGIIDPNTITTPPPPLDTTLPSTSIAIRLLNGKRIVVKINLQSPVLELGQHIGSSAGGGGGGAGGESYVMTSGYPPAVIEDLSVSVEEAGLKGAQVVLKKA